MRKVTVSFLVNAETDDQARTAAESLIRQADRAYGVVLVPAVSAVYATTSDFTVESVEEFTPESTEEPINA